MEEPSAEAYEAFDYVMNTRLTYAMLGEAVQMLERRARRHHRPASEELKNEISYGTFRASWTGWKELARRAVDEARKDYEQAFPEERPAWLTQTDPNEVLRIALEHRDRFGGKR